MRQRCCSCPYDLCNVMLWKVRCGNVFAVTVCMIYYNECAVFNIQLDRTASRLFSYTALKCFFVYMVV